MAENNYSLADLAADALIKDLKTALSAPLELLEILASSLDPKRGFWVVNEEQLIKAWSKEGLTAQQLSDTFGVLRHVHDFGVRTEKSADQLLDELQVVCEKHKIEGLAARRDLLRLMLSPSDQYRVLQRSLPWARSVLPNIVGLDANVELRAAFESGKSIELTGLIPMAIFRFALKYDDDEDEQTNRVAVQLTEETLDRVIAKLEQTKSRLSVLKRHVKNVDRVIELPRINEETDG